MFPIVAEIPGSLVSEPKQNLDFEQDSVSKLWPEKHRKRPQNQNSDIPGFKCGTKIPQSKCSEDSIFLLLQPLLQSKISLLGVNISGGIYKLEFPLTLVREKLLFKEELFKTKSFETKISW